MKPGLAKDECGISVSWRLEIRQSSRDQWMLVAEYNRIDPARRGFRTLDHSYPDHQKRLLEVTSKSVTLECCG